MKSSREDRHSCLSKQSRRLRWAGQTGISVLLISFGRIQKNPVSVNHYTRYVCIDENSHEQRRGIILAAEKYSASSLFRVSSTNFADGPSVREILP
jgi:hypothetical protein